MELIEIDVISPQPAQTFLAFPDEMVARGAAVVRTAAYNHPGFGRYKHAIPATFQNLAEDFLRYAVGGTVCGVEQIHTGLEAEVDLATSTVDIRGAYFTEDFAATESHRT